MRKSYSQRKRLIKELKTLIRVGRKLGRQINRKLESLAQINRMKQATKAELVKLSGLE